jgi:hypothetical protein
MPKYLCLQRKLPGGGDTQPSRADMQAMYAKFEAWRQKYQSNLVDLGGKLGASKLEAELQASDGPYIEIKELIGGYMIVSADSLDEAGRIARECPGLVRPGSGVHVLEIQTP